MLDPAWAGTVTATEAARAMLRLGFEDLLLHRIVGPPPPPPPWTRDNEPSAKPARRLGMRQEARLVHNEFFKGQWKRAGLRDARRGVVRQRPPVGSWRADLVIGSGGREHALVRALSS